MDVPRAVREVNLSEDIAVEYVENYADHPLAIQAMKEKIEGCK
ncbi:MAG TPA: hypothetical protein VLA72_05285 [Anaerolineales bacterium]|nr:hypothetical protein [Anaerolineales bacterium]